MAYDSNYHKKRYAENKERYSKSTKKRNIKKRAFVNNYKKDKCCEICGWKEHVEVLVFHHEDPQNKFKEVSAIYDETKIMEEIKKCILICPNCHYWIHYPKEEAE